MRFNGGPRAGFPSGVYWLELDQRRARSVFTAQGDDPVIFRHRLSGRFADPMLAIATRTRVLVLRPPVSRSIRFRWNFDLGEERASVALVPSPSSALVRVGRHDPA